MTVYYLSLNQGQKFSLGDKSSVTEGTSAPAATDILVTIGGGGNDISKLSRQLVIDALNSIENYVMSDGASGTPNIPFGLR